MSLFSRNKLPFKLGTKIAQGGFGDIYLTQYNNKNAIVKKIKQINYNETEYNISKKINNQYLCKCIGKYEKNKSVYLLFPYYKNGDLYESLHKINMSEYIAKHIIYQMLLTVEDLNQLGYVHCDIKPENFLLDSKKNLVLTDFGSAQPINDKESNNLYELLRPVGSKSYMPPEFSLHYYNSKSDIWSIGVCLYNIVTNKNLYEDILDYQYNTYFKKKSTLNYIKGKLSKNGVDLLVNMLDISPKKRISIESAKNHQWFSDIRDDYYYLYTSEKEIII